MMTSTCSSHIKLCKEFSKGQSETLRAHLEECDACLAYWKSMEQLQELCRELPVEDPSAERREAVLNAILTATAKQSEEQRAHKPMRFAFVAAIAASLAVLLVALIYFNNNEQTSPTQTLKGEQPMTRLTKAAIQTFGQASFTRISAQPNERIRLIDGSLSIEVEKLHKGERFVVTSADAEVEVRGTIFEVKVSNDRLMEVVVFEGMVEVRPYGKNKLMLMPGDSWCRDELKLATPETQNPAADSVDRNEQTKMQAESELEIEPADESSQAPMPKATPQEIAFEEGWTALKQGRIQRAIDSFEKSKAAAPDDPIAEDASFWLAVAQARIPNNPKAKEALQFFIHHYPNSPRVEEASAILGWRLIEAGNLKSAHASFECAELSKVPSVRKSAHNGLMEIERRQKNSDAEQKNENLPQ